MSRRFALPVIVALLGVVLVSSLVSCRGERSIKIGFIGSLSGRPSDLGVAARNGVMFAAEELNSRGGVNGKPVEMLYRDDQLDSQLAVEAFGELVDEGVVAVVGPLLSQVGEGLHPEIQKRQVLTIAPTVSTNSLSGQDDYFLRVYPASKQVGTRLADYVHNHLELNRVTVVFDTRNQAFSMCAFEDFRDRFAEHGGRIVSSHGFRSGQDVDFTQIARMICAAENDGVYIIAGAMDSAMLCQQLLKLGFDQRIILNDWAATDDLLQFGGRAVENTVFLHSMNVMCELERYKRFAGKFHRRFGRPPSYTAIHAYDSANVLFTALKVNPDPAMLKTTILEIGEFEGIQTTIRFDEFGDVERQLFPMTIQNAWFRRLED